MGQIYKTAIAENGKKKHSHLVYVTNDGQISVSQADNHTHEVQINPDGTFAVLPDPQDGHAHMGIGEVDVKIGKPKKEDDKEVVDRVYTLFGTAYEYEGKSIEAGKESEKFYAGEQWDESIKADLRAASRACLTINFTERNIDKLLGYQRQQRTDIRYMPTEGGDQRVCDILNTLSKSVLDQCYFESNESEVFEDQSIAGRGVFNLYMDFSEDLQGELKVERFPWDQVVIGPHEKRDASDAEYIVKYQMMSVARLKSRYPKFKDKIVEGFLTMTNQKGLDMEQIHANFEGDQYAMSSRVTPVMTRDGIAMVDIALKEMRVFELQEKIYEEVKIISDPNDEWFLNSYGWSDKDLKQVETIPGLHIIPVKRAKLRITRVVGDILLSDENPADVPVDDFYIVPVYAKKKKNKFWGKVESGKDPQRVINKRSSQMIDIGDRAVNYGWLYDDGTFRTEEEARKFKNVVSTPGFVAKVSSIAQPPIKLDGGKFPSELANMHDMAVNQLEAIQGIDPTSNAGANTSASAILQAEKTVLVGHEYLFDNLTFAKKRIGRMMLPIFQKYYSPRRIYRIVANRSAMTSQPQQQQQMPPQQGMPPGMPGQPPQGMPPQPTGGVQVGGVPFENYTQEEIEKLLEDSDLSKYDVVVGESTWSPTQRIATLTILTDLMGKGAPVPMDMMAQFLDMPEDIKQQMIQGIQAQQQQASASEMGKNETEIQKTLIGQGLFPPKVLEQQGLPPQTPVPQQGLPQGAPPPMPQGGYGGGPSGLI
jgi:hypothetical protein